MLGAVGIMIGDKQKERQNNKTLIPGFVFMKFLDLFRTLNNVI